MFPSDSNKVLAFWETSAMHQRTEFTDSIWVFLSWVTLGTISYILLIRCWSLSWEQELQQSAESHRNLQTSLVAAQWLAQAQKGHPITSDKAEGMFFGKHWISLSKKEKTALVLEESTPSAKGNVPQNLSIHIHRGENLRRDPQMCSLEEHKERLCHTGWLRIKSEPFSTCLEEESFLLLLNLGL